MSSRSGLRSPTWIEAAPKSFTKLQENHHFANHTGEKYDSPQIDDAHGVAHRMGDPGIKEDGGTQRRHLVGLADDMRHQNQNRKRRNILDQILVRPDGARNPGGHFNGLIAIADPI